MIIRSQFASRLIAGLLMLSTVSATAQTTQTGASLVNISARAPVGHDYDVIILGFVIEGGTMPVLVRGVGPTLRNHGIQNYLPDPVVTLFKRTGDGWTVVGQNDNWDGSVALQDTIRRLGAGTLELNSKDAAFVITLEPGVYTSVITISGDGPQGVALAEVYNATQGARTARFVNLSARVYAQGTGEAIGIVGAVVAGRGEKRFLIRGVGENLLNYGVPTAMIDPLLTVFNAQRVAIVSNDDWWRDGATAQMSATFVKTGAAALGANSRDAAVVVPFSVDGTQSFTAHVAGKSDSARGVVLAEIYEVQ